MHIKPWDVISHLKWLSGRGLDFIDVIHIILDRTYHATFEHAFNAAVKTPAILL